MPDTLLPLKGSDAIAAALRDSGIETIFTVAGGHFLPTYDAIGRQGVPQIVAARHELGAGYMAAGHALVTGRPGVVFSGAPGPGATNLATPVANAKADSIPLLVLTGQVDRRYLNRPILQYCDNTSLLGPFCKSSRQATSAAELPHLIATGLQIAASGRPGPVHIDLPQSLQAELFAAPTGLSAATMAPAEPAEADIAAILDALAGSRRPAILAGHGVLRTGGAAALRRLAEQIGAPVATSRSGIGSMPSVSPLSVGMLGFYGSAAAEEAIAAADLVVVAGCALGEQTTFGWRPSLFARDARVVQADLDPGVFNLTYPVELAIQADAGAFLTTLARRATHREPWFGGRRSPLGPANDPAKGLSAAEAIGAVNARLPDDAFVSADIGNHRLWVCDGLSITGPNRLLQSCEFDAMGFSLPAAIGAAIAVPGRRVLSISGDGGFVHTIGELAVAREHGLPLIAMVFVDGALGILRHQAEAMYGQEYFTGLAPIDFAQVATGFGIPARDVADENEIGDALDWAFAETGPVLVSVRIDPDEVFPPLQSKIEQRKRDLMGKG